MRGWQRILIFICITRPDFMRLLLIVDDYLPASIKVAARMMHDLALACIAQGHEVTVCTVDDTLNEPFVIEVLDGVRVLRYRTGSIKNVSRVRRAINETLLSFRAWRILGHYFKRNPHDLIIYYSPTIFFGPLVYKLKTLWQCRSFLILRDIFPQWVVDNGLIKKYSPVYFYFRLFELINYNAASVIAVQSPSNLSYFAKSGKYSPRLDVLYNWSSLESLPARNSVYREKLGLVGKVVFFYGGNIGHAQDMMNLVRLAKSLQDMPSAHFVFVGKGDEVALIERAIQADKLTNITYLPAVDQVEYEQMLSAFDVGLFSLHRDHKTHNFPGKLLGYMKQSLPILGSVNRGNDLEAVITVAGAGFVSVNGDDETLLAHALQLIYSAELRAQMGHNAYQLLKDQFSVSAAVQKILSHA
jgi:glycosyltransferase involved in cell wall biosynthesis